MAFTDTFTGTSGDNLEGRTGWALASGTVGGAQINASNQLKAATTSSTGSGYTAPSAGAADHYSQATILTSGGSGFGPCVRLSDANNYAGGYRYNVGQHQLFKRVAGTFTSLGTLSQSFDATAVMKVAATGNSIELFKNGSSILGPFTVADNNTVQTPGLNPRTALSDPWLDDWESTQAAGGGTTSGYLNLPLMGVG